MHFEFPPGELFTRAKPILRRAKRGTRQTPFKGQAFFLRRRRRESLLSALANRTIRRERKRKRNLGFDAVHTTRSTHVPSRSGRRFGKRERHTGSRPTNRLFASGHTLAEATLRGLFKPIPLIGSRGTHQVSSYLRPYLRNLQARTRSRIALLLARSLVPDRNFSAPLRVTHVTRARFSSSRRAEATRCNAASLQNRYHGHLVCLPFPRVEKFLLLFLELNYVN